AALWIPTTGAQWHLLPQCYPNDKTVHRRFQHWCRSEVLRGVLVDLASCLRDDGAVGVTECCIDASFASAKERGLDRADQTRKGVKILAIVDRQGLHLSVSTHAANHHEVTLVQLSFDFYMIEAKPENLIGDRAYDSDELDKDLKQQGTEMIAPHRANRKKRRTQDGRRLRRYERLWIVGRFFAWMQWYRRLLIRWEYYAENFLEFIQLASMLILFR
ncbi:MAG: IS5 family transposase, partial [Nitrospirae bacterium]